MDRHDQRRALAVWAHKARIGGRVEPSMCGTFTAVWRFAGELDGLRNGDINRQQATIAGLMQAADAAIAQVQRDDGRLIIACIGYGDGSVRIA